MTVQIINAFTGVLIMGAVYKSIPIIDNARGFVVILLLIVATEPVLLSLSSSGLADNFGILFLALGFFFTVNNEKNINHYANLSAICYAAASAVKLEYGFFCFAFVVFGAYDLIKQEINKKLILEFFIKSTLSTSYIIAFFCYNKYVMGDFMAFSKLFKNYYENSWIYASVSTPYQRFIFFPEMLFNGFKVGLFMVLPGLFLMQKNKENSLLVKSLIWLVVFPFILFSINAAQSVVPDNIGPGPRHVAPYILFLLIPVAFTLHWLVSKKIYIKSIGLLIILFICLAGIHEAFLISPQSSIESRLLGKIISEAYKKDVILPNQKVIFEEGFSLASDKPSNLDALTFYSYLPRNIYILNTTNRISGLYVTELNELTQVRSGVIKGDIALLIIYNKKLVSEIPEMDKIGSLGSYDIFVAKGNIRVCNFIANSLFFGDPCKKIS
jgi:hypothetical protein